MKSQTSGCSKVLAASTIINVWSLDTRDGSENSSLKTQIGVVLFVYVRFNAHIKVLSLEIVSGIITGLESFSGICCTSPHPLPRLAFMASSQLPAMREAARSGTV